ncbi:MAG TPA: hypothetical protein VGI70_00030, partial [Polyangiales bacterium]
MLTMLQERIAGARLALRGPVLAGLLCTHVIGCGSSGGETGTGMSPIIAGTGAIAQSGSGATTTAAVGGSTVIPVAGTSAPIAAAGTGVSVSAGSGSVVAGSPAPAAGSGATNAANGGSGGSAPAAGSGAAGGDPNATVTHNYLDPGPDDWVQVPEADVPTVCKLDVDKLKAAGQTATYPWLIVRYGKLCWQSNSDTFAPAEAWSTTKTLGALVTGIANYQTRMIPRTGPMTGQLSDEDMATQWIANPTYNKQAKVAHVLAMVAHDLDLSWPNKTFAYDTVGSTEINTLGNMITTAINQDPTRLGTTVADF